MVSFHCRWQWEWSAAVWGNSNEKLWALITFSIGSMIKWERKQSELFYLFTENMIVKIFIENCYSLIGL